MAEPGSVTCGGSELILGGQKSGKSRRAESLAGSWLAQSARHRALLLATAIAHDDEMQNRIARHQRDRQQRVPGVDTLEVPLDLAEAIGQHSERHTLLVIDCLGMWLTNQLMPAVPSTSSVSSQQRIDGLLDALNAAPGPVVLVSNEIGLGVIPMGRDVRAFVDALGMLNQSVAGLCERVTLMCAGLPLSLKGKR